MGSSFIDIALGVEDGMITFISANSVSGKNSDGPQVASGIGLDNVRKRLALLYPGRHDLRIDNQETVFTVKLTVRS